MVSRTRLDVWLVEHGYFGSRQQAQRAVQAGQVKVEGQVIDKPGTQVSGSLIIDIQARPQYVSRGGDKLAGALSTFSISVDNRVCLDGGISTGGFTDCLLQHSAQCVYGVDVGYGQVAWSLQTDPRVHIQERTNLRHLTPDILYSETDPLNWPDLATVDVSFISLTKVLPALWSLLQSPRDALLLVKPQFEAGRNQVGKKGVVRDPQIHAAVLSTVLATGIQLGWRYQGHTWSPVMGPAGNIEYWLWLSECAGTDPPALTELVMFCQRVKSHFIASDQQ